MVADDYNESIFKKCPCGKTDDLFVNEFTDMCFSCGRTNITMLGDGAYDYYKSLPKLYRDKSVGKIPDLYCPMYHDNGKEILVLEKLDTGELIYVITPYVVDEDGDKRFISEKVEVFDFMNFKDVFKRFFNFENK
jgi:hypothetical protein